MIHGTLSTAALLFFGVCATAGAATTAGAAIDDSVITAKVKSSLVEDPKTKAHEIKVKTVNGTVQLSGFVDAPASKQRAQEIANATEGVTYVHNELKIGATETTMGRTADDSILTTKVKAALVKNPATKARDIKVTTLREVVQLSGFVDSPAEKVEASKVAASITGVKNVENDIAIKSP